MNRDEWIAEARRYADHIWCYPQLIDDFPEAVEISFTLGENPYSFVEYLGEKYDLDRADRHWGINSDKEFDKKPEFTS
jgi:hypothetical protein